MSHIVCVEEKVVSRNSSRGIVKQEKWNHVGMLRVPQGKCGKR